MWTCFDNVGKKREFWTWLDNVNKKMRRFEYEKNFHENTVIASRLQND
jgi:hypothetical protein